MNDNFDGFGKGMFAHWAENQPRLADEIPFYRTLHYSAIEHVDPEAAIDVLKRLTDLHTVQVDKPVQDIERFLEFLKNVDKITELRFECDQPQELFDRLPEHCAVQNATITHLPPDHQFLARLEQVNVLHVNVLDVHRGSLDVGLVRRILKKLQFLSEFKFFCIGKRVTIRLFKKRFYISINESALKLLPDLNTAIQVISESSQ